MTFDRMYVDWNHKRIKKIINHFGHQAFYEKTVLDLGCGHADQSGALARLGARVIAVDARQEHLTIAKKKYPHITTMCVDLDQSWPFGNQKFDFVLVLGLVCHLTNYKQLLQRACAVSDNLVLESEICDSNDPARVVQIDEHRSIYDWAFNGVGYKPSAPHLEKILQESGMSFNRIDSSDLNTGPFKYDWVVNNTNSRKIGYRRFWVVKKNNNVIINPPPPPPPPPKPTHLNTPPLTVRPEIIYSSKEISSPKKEGFRTAVCISGYLRSFEKTFDRIFNNLLKQTNPDIFIHTWDYMGAPHRSFDGPMTKVSTHSLLHQINKLYKPTKLVIEPAINFPIIPLMQSKNLDRRDINGVLSMFYKIKACNQIKKNYETQNNFKYDCVIRMRSDLMFMSPFYINKDVNMNKLYIPLGYDYEGINDQLAYGSSDIIDEYCQVFDNIEQLLIDGEKLNPEKLLKQYIINKKLPLERVHMHYYIKRVI